MTPSQHRSDGHDGEEPYPETLLVTGGRPSGAGAPLNVPITPASNFRTGDAAARAYSRDDATDGWEALESVIGALEGGPAVTFASGMAAVAAVIDLLPAGSRVVACNDAYAGTRALLEDGRAGGRWSARFIDTTDTASAVAAIADADLVWLESPSNPLLEVAHLPALCAAGRAEGATVVVDNTFATPLLQRPLDLGAHVVVHSATKFMGGHSDLLLGAAIASTQELGERLRERRALAGATPGALEVFLTLRGIRTLAVRLERAQASAGELARRLAAHPAVVRVRYPGLPGDPGHGRASAQMRGFGAVLSFELANAAAADHVCETVRVVTSATSLGGVETTIERRAKLPGSEHVPPGLLRVSVGVEHVEDLWRDLDAAIGSATGR